MNEIKKGFATKTLIKFYGSNALEKARRIEKIGIEIASEKSSVDVEVVRWFAYLHAMDLNLSTCRNNLLSELSDEQMRQLAIACKTYLAQTATDDETVNACKDAYWRITEKK